MSFYLLVITMVFVTQVHKRYAHRPSNERKTRFSLCIGKLMPNF